LDAAEKVVLDRDDVARAVVRMAHEVVERNADRDSPLAIVGIHRRGVHLAARLHAQVSELLAVPVALGAAHQAGALLLLTSALMANHQLQLTANSSEQAQPAAPRRATG
jgi:heme A synthase